MIGPVLKQFSGSSLSVAIEILTGTTCFLSQMKFKVGGQTKCGVVVLLVQVAIPEIPGSGAVYGIAGLKGWPCSNGTAALLFQHQH